MKARKGEKIVCECGTVAGHFCEEVNDDQAISGKDIVMDNVRNEIDWSYKCACGKEVVKVENGSWRVRVSNRWI